MPESEAWWDGTAWDSSTIRPASPIGIALEATLKQNESRQPEAVDSDAGKAPVHPPDGESTSMILEIAQQYAEPDGNRPAVTMDREELTTLIRALGESEQKLKTLREALEDLLR
jgi:hypothetical protein